jgi:hypothetical protein
MLACSRSTPSVGRQPCDWDEATFDVTYFSNTAPTLSGQPPVLAVPYRSGTGQVTVDFSDPDSSVYAIGDYSVTSSTLGVTPVITGVSNGGHSVTIAYTDANDGAEPADSFTPSRPQRFRYTVNQTVDIPRFPNVPQFDVPPATPSPPALRAALATDADGDAITLTASSPPTSAYP